MIGVTFNGSLIRFCLSLDNRSFSFGLLVYNCDLLIDFRFAYVRILTKIEILKLLVNRVVFGLDDGGYHQLS